MARRARKSTVASGRAVATLSERLVCNVRGRHRLQPSEQLVDAAATVTAAAAAATATTDAAGGSVASPLELRRRPQSNAAPTILELLLKRT